MAWVSPLDPLHTEKTAFVDVCEWAYLYIFTVEMILKIVSYGFLFTRKAYLTQPWCQLDFVIVALAWLPVVNPAFGNYSVIRSFRALRPLRALKRVPGMPGLVQSIMSAIPKLGHVGVVCAFLFIVFGIIGTDFFKYGPAPTATRCLRSTRAPPLHTKRDEEAVGYSGPAAVRTFARNLKGAGSSGDGMAHFDSGKFCLMGEQGFCSEGQECHYFEENPESGTISFDSVLIAQVTLLKVLTFDTWTDAMYALMKVVSPYVWIYFIAFALLGGFFLVNLFLAVIFDEFLKSQKSEKLLTVENDKKVESPSTHVDDGSMLFRYCDCDPRTGSCRAFVKRMVSTDWFTTLSTVTVIVNVVIMCMPYVGMSKEYAECLEVAAHVISGIFMFEMLLKMFGLGCKGYWSDGWNALDGTIVIISAAEVVVTVFFSAGEGNVSFLRILRMLRVARMLRLMRSWQGLYRIVMAFTKSIPQVRNLFILMTLVTFIFALLGMQLFGGTFDPIEQNVRTHFDYIGPAMITVFLVMTGGWVDAYETCAEASGVATATAFFVAAVVIGTYIITNLFIAILLEAFSDDDHDDEKEHVQVEKVDHDSAIATSPEQTYRPWAEEGGKVTWPRDYVYLCLSPHNPIRRLCRATVSSNVFNNFIIVIILASSAALALDSPRLAPNSELSRWLSTGNLVFTALFTAEMLLKWTAYGLCCGNSKAYFKNRWNQLDFVIVVASLLQLLSDWYPPFEALREMRLLRVLRPLRLLARNEGMKLILITLVNALPAVLNVTSVVLAIQLVFAVSGMQLFADSFGSCTDPSIRERTMCEEEGLRQLRALEAHGGATAGQPPPTAWLNPALGSFDDFHSAMMLLYISSTGDGWEDFMWAGMDASEPGHAPVRNDFSPAALFFITWMFIGGFVSMNLFVGAIVDNFQRIKAETDGSATMTKAQHQWVLAMKTGMSTKVQRGLRAPTGFVRRSIFNLVTSHGFDIFIMLVITLNILLMTLNYYRMEEDVEYFTWYYYLSDGFAYVYYCEAVLKLLGLGFQQYFMSRWCQFDFFIVCGSLLDQFGTEEIERLLPVPPSLLRVVRLVRVFRILRLFKGSKGIRDLITTIVISLPSLGNVGALLVVVTFIYSVVGVSLFTYVQRGELLTDDRNFDHFFNAFLLLFQCLTGDAWSGLMQDAMVTPDRGCNREKGDCGSVFAVPYFITYMIFGSFVLLNLVVAVILENFTILGSQNPDLVSREDIARFKEVWAVFDPDADGKIHYRLLPKLLSQLPHPMGLQGRRGLIDDAELEKEALALSIKMAVSGGLCQEAGNIKFQDLLEVLVQYNAQEIIAEGVPEEISMHLEPTVMKQSSSSRRRSFKVDQKNSVDPAQIGDQLTARSREMYTFFEKENKSISSESLPGDSCMSVEQQILSVPSRQAPCDQPDLAPATAPIARKTPPKLALPVCCASPHTKEKHGTNSGNLAVPVHPVAKAPLNGSTKSRPASKSSPTKAAKKSQTDLANGQSSMPKSATKSPINSAPQPNGKRVAASVSRAASNPSVISKAKKASSQATSPTKPACNESVTGSKAAARRGSPQRGATTSGGQQQGNLDA
eukprot:CAMPEP_0205857742 /NCGR_PEP_ID=MMETSP1083-20121108/3824_1 /ASSEMBLY_ACC=CAM_ASM_000430 /TAXON_ID=97485 /ORGANISM="Prymnesium parvum, Strain Texoma1" /LENGTH=1580 /DNA_ID=CAMNT_0053219251 /DNA_START=327 /DNA_END=5070 /DNA_ORIENTATION=+